MKFLKLQKGNITHKFTDIPKDFDALEKLISKTFRVDYQSHRLYFQSTPILSNEDYQFLKQQSSPLNQTLRLKINQVSHKYYLEFPFANTPVTKQNAPDIQIIQKIQKPQKIRETRIPERQVTKVKITENQLKQIRGQKVWSIRATGYPEMGVFCENTRRAVPMGDIKVQNGEKSWRLWYMANGIRKLTGKRLGVLDNEDHQQNAEILTKARIIREDFGGSVLEILKFIKQKNLEFCDCDEIKQKMVDDILN